jgi:alpha-N-arabinofuranosidase
MNRRRFLAKSAAVIVGPLSIPTSSFVAERAMAASADPRVAILLVDTDRVIGTINERIYGHFLEEINHSAVDGLYAEQIRGCGFEGKDFETYW